VLHLACNSGTGTPRRPCGALDPALRPPGPRGCRKVPAAARCADRRGALKRCVRGQHFMGSHDRAFDERNMVGAPLGGGLCFFAEC
jgi:hypothetical protein